MAPIQNKQPRALGIAQSICEGSVIGWYESPTIGEHHGAGYRMKSEMNDGSGMIGNQTSEFIRPHLGVFNTQS